MTQSAVADLLHLPRDSRGGSTAAGRLITWLTKLPFLTARLNPSRSWAFKVVDKAAATPLKAIARSDDFLLLDEEIVQEFGSFAATAHQMAGARRASGRWETSAREVAHRLHAGHTWTAELLNRIDGGDVKALATPKKTRQKSETPDTIAGVIAIGAGRSRNGKTNEETRQDRAAAWEAGDLNHKNLATYLNSKLPDHGLVLGDPKTSSPFIAKWKESELPPQEIVKFIKVVSENYAHIQREHNPRRGKHGQAGKKMGETLNLTDLTYRFQTFLKFYKAELLRVETTPGREKADASIPRDMNGYIAYMLAQKAKKTL